MAKYGLKLTEVKHLDSMHIQQHPDFPTPRGAEPMLRGLREKSLKPGDFYNYKGDSLVATGALEEPGGAVAIWKLTGYHADREATLDDPGMLEHFTDEYKKKKRQDLAKEEAEAFRKAVEDKVNAAGRREGEGARDAAMTLEIDKQIARSEARPRRSAEDKPKILEIENAEKKKKDDRGRRREGPGRAEHVPGRLPSRSSSRVRDTGWIAKTSTRNATFAPNDKLTSGEKAEQFFRKPQRRTALAAHEGRPHGRRRDRAELVRRGRPAPDRAPRADPGGSLQAEQERSSTTLKSQVNPRSQTQTVLELRELQAARVVQPERAHHREVHRGRSARPTRSAPRRSASQDEQKKKTTKARAEKFAQDAMQSRPLFTGEDW